MTTTPTKEHSVFWDYFTPYVVGSVAGSCASTTIQPIETVKVIIQARREAAGKSTVNLSPFHVGKDIIQKNGFSSLYHGLDSAIFRQFIYGGIRLGLFKVIEDDVKAKHNRNLTFLQKVKYSLLTGAIGSFIANPTDMALIRFQSDNDLPPAQRRNYKNVFDALYRIYKEEGIGGLWRGSFPTTIRAMSANCSHLVSYKQAKQLILKFLEKKEDNIPIRLVASAFSGMAVSVCSLPFDNVKTKILKMKPIAQGVFPYSGFFDCFAKSIKNEGVTGLWVGLPTYYMRIGPHAMITLLVQDAIYDLLKIQHKH